MKERLISVVMPCFNAALFIRSSIASLQYQSYQHWECIIVDDGSTDESAEIIKSIAIGDSRIRYFYQKNAGPTKARNKGVQKTKGEFIQFLDADDIITPDRFEKCIHEFQAHPEKDIVFSDYMTYQTGQGCSRILPAKMPYTDPVRSLLFENNITFVILIHSLLFKKKVVETVPFDESLPTHAEDIDCWIQMALKGFTFHYVDEILSIYRHTGNSLGSDEITLMNARLQVLEKYQNHQDCIQYSQHFTRTVLYTKQRLCIAMFMHRKFRNGFRLLHSLWSDSDYSSKVKMMGWGILSLFFSKESIAKTRAIIVSSTFIRWGAWKQLQAWQPSNKVLELLEQKVGQ